MLQIDYDDLFPEPNSIELLGYAKNDLIEVLRSAPALPLELKTKLRCAYWYVNEVQEYLFIDPIME